MDKRKFPCRGCWGTGVHESKTVRGLGVCRICHGRGFVYRYDLGKDPISTGRPLPDHPRRERRNEKKKVA